jgi:hypothetical protein
VAERGSVSAEVAARFRRETDWFVARKSSGFYVAQVGTIGERAVDLLPALALHLDPAVDMTIESLRDKLAWDGKSLALPDVREVIGRLRLPLAMYGGVEIALMSADDQLTLTPELQLVVYSRTDRWFFLLDGMGLVERSAPPPAVWTPSRRRLQPVGDLTVALNAAAERLALAVRPLA